MVTKYAESFKIKSTNESKTPIELSAQVLKELKTFVNTGDTLDAVVITITNAPIVNAGLNLSICKNNTASVLSGPVAGQDAPVEVAVEPTAEATSAAPSPSISSPAKKDSTMVSGLSIKGAKLAWPGLDTEGLPTSLSVTGKNGEIGKIRLNKNVPVATEAGTVLSTQAITASGGPNVMLLQTITVDGNGTSYKLDGASYGKDGFWSSLETGATSADFERMSNGQYLVTVRISIVSTLPLGYVAPVGTRGYDLSATPKSITTRLLLNAGKTQILAQSIYVDESNAGKA